MKTIKLIVSTIISSLILLNSIMTFSVNAAPDKKDSITVIVGDFDNNGVADLTDLSGLCVYLMNRNNISLDRRTFAAADVDKNQQTDIADLARLKQYVSKDMSVPSLGTVEIPRTNTDKPDQNNTGSEQSSVSESSAPKQNSLFPDNIPDASQDSSKQQILNAINSLRQKNNIKNTEMTSELSYVADIRAKELSTNYTSSFRPDGSSYTTLLQEYGKLHSSFLQIVSTADNVYGMISTINNYEAKVSKYYYTECGIGHYSIGSSNYWVVYLID